MRDHHQPRPAFIFGLKPAAASIAFFLVASFSGIGPSFAGGPIIVNGDGSALYWDSPIDVHPEGGDCATFSSANMRTKLETNLDYWSDITGIELEFDLVNGTISSDLDADNYGDYFASTSADSDASDGVNPIIYDDTGEIIVDVFGIGNQYAVLGFAGPDNFNDAETRITDGQAVFNCRCLNGNPSGACTVGGTTIVFSEEDLDFTMVHEIGHMIGLDHSQINQPLAEAGCDDTVSGDCDDVPTMFPVSVDAPDQVSPQRDDEVSILSLYGLSDLEGDTCIVTGTLLGSDGNPLRCADVQAETGDTAHAIATVSGAYAPNQDSDGDGYTSGSGECLSDCGAFTLRGLDPDRTYTITVRPVDSIWVGGSSVGPCGDGQPTGVVEEEIATVTSGDCQAGGTHDLGTVETASTSDGTGGDDDDDSGGSAALEGEIPALCGLNPAAGSPAHAAAFALMLAFEFALFSLARKPSGAPRR